MFKGLIEKAIKSKPLALFVALTFILFTVGSMMVVNTATAETTTQSSQTSEQPSVSDSGSSASPSESKDDSKKEDPSTPSESKEAAASPSQDSSSPSESPAKPDVTASASPSESASQSAAPSESAAPESSAPSLKVLSATAPSASTSPSPRAVTNSLTKKTSIHIYNVPSWATSVKVAFGVIEKNCSSQGSFWKTNDDGFYVSDLISDVIVNGVSIPRSLIDFGTEGGGSIKLTLPAYVSYTVKHSYYKNNTYENSTSSTFSGYAGMTVDLSDIDKVTSYNGKSYDFTSYDPKSDPKISSGLVITLRYDRYTFNITTNVVNGTITPLNPSDLDRGSDKEISYSPISDKYYLDSVIVDDFWNITLTNPSKFTFNNITDNHKISVVYAPKHYLHIDVDGPADLSLDKQVDGVSEPGYPKNIPVLVTDVSASYTVGSSTKNADFLYGHIAGQWHTDIYTTWPDSITITATLKDTATGITYPFSHTYTGSEIQAAFDRCPTSTGFDFHLSKSVVQNTITHKVTFKTLTGGTINGGTTDIVYPKVADGDHLPAIPATAPQPHYTFDGWYDSSNNKVTTWPTTVTSDLTYTAKWTLKTYKIDTTVTNGTIAPVNPSGIVEGTDRAITYMPDANYHIKSVKVDGVAQNIVTYKDGYTFTNIQANHAIDVVFEHDTYKIDTTVTNGTITPVNPSGITVGTDKAFTYTPDANYHIKSVTVDGVAQDIVTYKDGYTFTNIQANHAIDVVFEHDTYKIDTTVTNGTITPVNPSGIAVGTDKAFTYTPDTGYHIKSVNVDGVAQDIVTYKGGYTFTNIQANHAIDVVFEHDTYKIDTTVTNGTITPVNPSGIAVGTDKAFTYTPDTGYHIASVKVDGVSQNIVTYKDGYTFTNIQANHAIDVVFEHDTYKIDTTVTNGTITPVNPSGIAVGTDQAFTYTPDTNYHIASVTVDGVAQDIVTYKDGYTFTNIQANHAIDVVFEHDTYKIDTTVTNGTITPVNPSGIAVGTDQAFTYTPDTNYHIASVKVDGVTQDIVTYKDGYTFTNIQTNHAIDVVFEHDTYKIDTTVTGGTITPVNPSGIAVGTDQAFTYTPDADYHIASVTVDGVAQDIVTYKDGYTFTNIQANHAIDVVFEHDTYKIDTTVTNGTITPVNPSGIAVGTDKAFTYTPDTGYHIASVKVDGVAQDIVTYKDGYTFTNIQANHAIDVVFEHDTYKIDTTVTNGTITPVNPSGIAVGTDTAITYTPDANYHIASVKVDGVAQDIATYKDGYTFTNIQANHAIDVVFEHDTYKIDTTVANGTITPLNPSGIAVGTDTTVAYTPDTGYHLFSVIVDGVDVTATSNDHYTFTNIQADHKVSVVYVHDTYAIDTTVANGTITPAESGIGVGSDRTVKYAPNAGYHLTSVTVDGTDVTADYPDSYTFGGISANHVITVVYTKDATGALMIKKVDATTLAALPNAVFAIYNDAAKTSLYKDNINVGATGEAVIADMKPGDYWVVETAAPAGYTLSTAAIKVTITASNTLTLVVPNTATEAYKTGNLKIVKIDASSGKTLKGAEFAIYSDAALTNKVEGGLTTNSSGAVTSEGLDVGSYWIVETLAPDGYTKYSGSIKATVTDGKTTTITVKDSKTKEEDYQTGTNDYNYLVLGGIFLLAGLTFILLSRRKVKAK